MENRNNTTTNSSTAEGGGNFIEPQLWRWTLRLIFISVFLVGSVGNLVVCSAVIRRKRMRTSNNIFTFNLAVSDLLTVIIYVPTQMAAFENNHNWPLGNFACQIAYITIPVCLSASIATLLAITSDRYRAIAFPMKPRLSSKRIRVILLVIWTMSILVALPLVFVAGETRPAPGQVYCDEVWPEGPYSRIYWISIFVIQYVVPLAMICVLAVLIALKIRKNSLEMIEKTSHVLAAAVRQRMKQTSKITNMLIALVTLYAVCMLPQHVVYLSMIYGDLNQFKYRVYVIRFANVFPMANSALNPIAYGTLNKEFKIVFKSFFKCECNKLPMEESQVDGFSRSRRFRLAIYRHVDDQGNSVLEYGRKWRRKSSSISIFSRDYTRRDRNATFRARKNSAIGGLKGNFSTEDTELNRNGHIPRKTRTTRSLRRPGSSAVHSKTRYEEVKDAIPMIKEEQILEEDEMEKLLPVKEELECFEKSYSSLGKNNCFDQEDPKTANMEQNVVKFNEHPSEVDLTSSLEWDPMTFGSLLLVPIESNDTTSRLPLTRTQDKFIINQNSGRHLDLGNPYNPVNNFHKFVDISTKRNGGKNVTKVIELESSIRGMQNRDEIHNSNPVPSGPILNVGEFDREFFEYIRSIRETSV